MYVLTLCRDYISVTSNGPCTFPGGRGVVSHYSLFWGHIKDPALVSLGKKAILAIPTYFLFMHLPFRAFKPGHPEMK